MQSQHLRLYGRLRRESPIGHRRQSMPVVIVCRIDRRKELLHSGLFRRSGESSSSAVAADATSYAFSDSAADSCAHPNA